jgi:hypothetical protein
VQFYSLECLETVPRRYRSGVGPARGFRWEGDREPPPKFKADPPASILIPNKIDIRLLGTLDFFYGMPSNAVVEKSYDFLVVSCGVEAFLSGMPAAFLSAALEGFKNVGME